MWLKIERHAYIPQIGLDEWRDTGIRVPGERALQYASRYADRHGIDVSQLRTVPADLHEPVVRTVCGL